MSEELLHEETHTEENAMTMADLEDHFDDANPWNLVTSYMEKGTILPVKVEGIVNGGAIAMVEGLRGFIPASKLSLSYIEDLETYLLKDIEVRVIDVNQADNRLVLSAREILKEREKEERERQIASVKVGTVMSGTVETLQKKACRIMVHSSAWKMICPVWFTYLRSARRESNSQKMY